jgi:hypothetical protein
MYNVHYLGLPKPRPSDDAFREMAIKGLILSAGVIGKYLRDVLTLCG